MTRYKLQLRPDGAPAFADASDWLDCPTCIQRMRAFSPLHGDLQILGERGEIIATTADPVLPTRGTRPALAHASGLR